MIQGKLIEFCAAKYTQFIKSSIEWKLTAQKTLPILHHIYQYPRAVATFYCLPHEVVPFKINNVTFRARNFCFLFKNSPSSNPLNMRSMYPGGCADIHFMKINRNITPGNKEFSLLRNMRFLQVMTSNFIVF